MLGERPGGRADKEKLKRPNILDIPADDLRWCGLSAVKITECAARPVVRTIGEETGRHALRKYTSAACLVLAVFTACRTVLHAERDVPEASLQARSDLPMNPSEARPAPALATVCPSGPEVLYFGVWAQVPCHSVPDRRRSNSPFAACEVAFRGSLGRWLGSR